MIFEVVVTSAVKGIRAGRSGFQPVMRTKALREDVLQQLEPLAAYRHVHPQGSGKNPVCFSFNRVRTNIGELFVLVRTVDAGSDYSSRSNKCSHIIAISADEVTRFFATTPAHCFDDNPAVFSSQWNQNPELRESSPSLNAVAHHPVPCNSWANMFGDAGWAGVVAERIRSGRQTQIVLPDCGPQSSAKLLHLFGEAIALLNPNERWQATFETTVIGNSRALLQGTYSQSPELETQTNAVLRLQGGVHQPVPAEFSNSPLVQLAREGERTPAQAVGGRLASPGKTITPPLRTPPTTDKSLTKSLMQGGPPAPSLPPPSSPPQTPSSPQAKPPNPAFIGRGLGNDPLSAVGDRKGIRNKWVFIGIPAAVVVVFGLVGTGIYLGAPTVMKVMSNRFPENQGGKTDSGGGNAPGESVSEGQTGNVNGEGKVADGGQSAGSETKSEEPPLVKPGAGEGMASDETGSGENVESSENADPESQLKKKEAEEEGKIAQEKAQKEEVSEQLKKQLEPASVNARPKSQDWKVIKVVSGVSGLEQILDELEIETSDLVDARQEFAIKRPTPSAGKESIEWQWSRGGVPLGTFCSVKAKNGESQDLVYRPEMDGSGVPQDKLHLFMPFRLKWTDSAGKTVVTEGVTLRDLVDKKVKPNFAYQLAWTQQEISPTLLDLLKKNEGVKLFGKPSEAFEQLLGLSPQFSFEVTKKTQRWTDPGKIVKNDFKNETVSVEVDKSALTIALNGKSGEQLVSPIEVPLVTVPADASGKKIVINTSPRSKFLRDSRIAPNSMSEKIKKLRPFLDAVADLKQGKHTVKQVDKVLADWFKAGNINHVDLVIVDIWNGHEKDKEVSKAEWSVNKLWSLESADLKGNLKSQDAVLKGAYGDKYAEKWETEYTQSKASHSLAFWGKLKHERNRNQIYSNALEELEKINTVKLWATILRGRLLKAYFKEKFPDDYRKSYLEPDKTEKPDEKPDEKEKREASNTSIGDAVEKRDKFFDDHKDDEKLFELFKYFEEKVQGLDKQSRGRGNGKGDDFANILREREQLFTTLIGYVAGKLYFELRPIYVWALAKDALDGPKGLLKADLSEALTATATVKAAWPTDEKSKPLDHIVVGIIRPSVPSKPEPPTENKRPAGDSSSPQPTPQPKPQSKPVEGVSS